MESSKPASQKSWVDVLGHNRIKTEASSLHFIAPRVKNGQRRVHIQSKEVKSEADKWRFALIGSVDGDNP